MTSKNFAKGIFIYIHIYVQKWERFGRVLITSILECILIKRPQLLEVHVQGISYWQPLENFLFFFFWFFIFPESFFVLCIYDVWREIRWCCCRFLGISTKNLGRQTFFLWYVLIFEFTARKRSRLHVWWRDFEFGFSLNKKFCIFGVWHIVAELAWNAPYVFLFFISIIIYDCVEYHNIVENISLSEYSVGLIITFAKMYKYL